MATDNTEYLGKHKKFRSDYKKLAAFFFIAAIIVAIIVFWWLKLIGITATGEAFCGINEHTHSDDCYISEIICGFEETVSGTLPNEEQTSLADESEATEENTTEETTEEAEETTTAAETHIHTDDCYKKTLSCSLPEHTHTVECFPDKTADVETVSDWLNTIKDVEITNNIPENLIAIALSQVGYTESQLNFEYDDEGNKNGYTRYGEWYGNPYGKWNAMFASFCLHYANINNVDGLKSAGAEAMKIAWQSRYAYSPKEEYAPQRGDVIFLDNDGDTTADSVGIILSVDETSCIVVMGDSNNRVETVSVNNSDNVVGYGITGDLFFAEDMEYKTEEETQEQTTEPETEPLMLFSTGRSNITYTSQLEGEVVNAEFKTQTGEVIGNGSTVYIGQSYVISLEFSEINTGSQWIQFRHDTDGYLTYHIPSNLQCEPFTSWQPISATTENGSIKDVGEYFVDEDGLLRVRFFEDSEGVNFVEKYANVDFTIDFNATVASTQSGTSTEVIFNDEIRIDLNIDSGAGMTVTKTQEDFDFSAYQTEYTVEVKATHGVVKDLVLHDDIWENHHVLLDTVVVTDLEGNILDPQPTISQNQDASAHGAKGFMITDFPDFQAGEGFLITYKTEVDDNMLSNGSVGMWNGAYANGKDSLDNNISANDVVWHSQELKNFEKEGNQVTVELDDGTKVDLIEWVVRLNKGGANLNGTVIIDTLGAGLEYYQGIPIKVRGVNANGVTRTTEIQWTDVTVNGNTMSFELPFQNDYKITYYTSFDPLQAGETEKTYTNSAKVTVDGEELETNGAGQVVGFSPEVKKTAWGTDGEYVYFNIETNVAAMLKDRGYFYLTDLCAFWNYPSNGQTLYVENIPEDLVITATLESGEVVTFTPYVSGSTDNTYVLEAPVLTNSGEAEYHTFRIYFNTRRTQYSASSWIHDENATINISYKLPFDSRTGSNWTGVPNGEKTLGDVLLEKEKLANEAYFNFMQDFSVTGVTNYEYSPVITKNAVVNEDGTIDYTVVFNNTVPGTGGDGGYLTSAQVINFTDTFDEKLEYVEDSLTVTCYDPWREGLWLNKYKYSGSVEGNSMNISATELLFHEYNYAGAQYNPDGSNLWGTWLTGCGNYLEYCNAMRGGEHIFTYKLRIKDEYMETTEHSKLILDNTAELKWDTDGSSGPVTESSEYETGLIDKQVVQENNKLDFDIHVNRRALDILEGSDTLTIEDTMTSNLSVYWDSIKLLYEDENGNWIDFDSTESDYSYTVTYDQVSNKLTFIVPDELHIRIDYTTLITQSGLVSVNNAVKIDGKAEVSDIIDAVFRVDEYSGGASGSLNNITLLKQDGDTDLPLPDVTFYLYGPMGDLDATVPSGADESITAEDGTTLHYIGSYTTGDDGTVYIETQYLTLGGPYAFVEAAPPTGYSILEKPAYFYFYSPDSDGIIQTVTTIIAIENYTYGFVLPETGGTGTLPLTIIGFALMATPILYSILRRKRERRFN